MRPLALAPISHAWTGSVLTSFYEKVALNTQIEQVYLGEVVCQKRSVLSLNAWLEMADILHSAGKKVVFSLPWLVNSRSDERWIDKVLSHWSGMVEANDLTGVAAASAAKRPFVGGNQLAIYNAATLSWMTAQGMQMWSPPVEMSKQWLSQLLTGCQSSPVIELFAFGRTNLGISARCIQAREARTSRQQCKKLCVGVKPPVLETLNGESLLVANGHTVMSASECNLLALEINLPDYVDSLRVSLSYPEQLAKLEQYRQGLAFEQCNGFWFGKSGAEKVTPK